jgi:hypothetical protein
MDEEMSPGKYGPGGEHGDGELAGGAEMFCWTSVIDHIHRMRASN